MPEGEGIQVTFLDQTGAKSVKARISPTVEVKRIIPNIITKMQLPVTAPDGTPSPSSGRNWPSVARIDAANSARATLLLSVHLNGYEDASQKGTEVYYDDTRPFALRSKRFATLLQDQLVEQLAKAGYQTRDRGVKATDRAAGAGNSFYLLGSKAARPSQMPGALSESLFLTNAGDAEKLRDPAVIEAIAQAHARAVMAYYVRE